MLGFLPPWTCLLFALSLLPAAGQTGPARPREYAIKAAYLFHFTQFIEWPASSVPPPGQPIQIGVVEPNPFGTLLEEIVRGQTVNGHPIEVAYFDDLDRAADCQILFIPNAAGEIGRRAVERLQGEPVLLVGEDLGFLRIGGMISLVTEQDRILIAANRTALEQAGLNASARLLRLARLVENPLSP